MMRTQELGVSDDDSGVVCTPRRLIGKCQFLASQSTSHSIQNMESFESRVLGFLTFVPRVIAPQHDSPSRDALWHGHSSGYIVILMWQWKVMPYITKFKHQGSKYITTPNKMLKQ